MTYLKQVIPTSLPVLALALAALVTPDRAAADADPFLGEVAPMGIVNFCPRGWASTDGQLLSIASNTALFSLLGTTFGGDGRSTFGLPDLRGRNPVGVGSGPGLFPRALGSRIGQEEATLNIINLAGHNHQVRANNEDGDKPGPAGKLLAAAPPGGNGTETIYSDQGPTVTMSADMIADAGGEVPLSLLDPTQVIRYCIATVGTYPSRP
ncbi:phage tail protein [Puniceibacterium confluentis]|uniref:phage tail protein n=1 Tax=Puniceibacterium confluentis TaxID=1958944 RepID=UPI0011B727F7|nr:tail fiber protein [Puniceibacterium confluentis]